MPTTGSILIYSHFVQTVLTSRLRFACHDSGASEFESSDRIPITVNSMMLRRLRDRLTEPYYLGLRDSLHARIESGELTENMELFSVLDSLDIVQLTLEIEEMAFEPSVPIKTVGDLLWLLRAIEFQLEPKKRP